jgi:predicted ATP-dependent protease
LRPSAVVGPDEFEKLPEAEQRQIQKDIEELQGALEDTIHQVPLWEKERRERLRDLNRQVVTFVVSHHIDALRARYRELHDIVAYLDAVERDVVENFDAFLAASADKGSPSGAEGPSSRPRNDGRFRRYQVNVLVDSTGAKGAPVVYEDNPTYLNLVGAVEHLSEMGALVTDFGLIKGGSLHRANDGYLVLDAHKLLTQPFAWDALKRCLRSREIRIEAPGQMLSLVTTVSLTPEPVPLAIKVVLVGERWLYSSCRRSTSSSTNCSRSPPISKTTCNGMRTRPRRMRG